MSNQTSRLSIVLTDGVTGPAKGIAQSLKNLGVSAKDIGKLEQIGKFRELQKGLIASRQQFAAAQVEVKKLGKEIAAVDKPTREMQRAFTAAQRGVKSAAAEFRQQASAIKTSRAELERAGIPLSKLAGEEARLRSSIAATTAAIQNQTRAHRVLAGVRKTATGAAAQTVGGIVGLATGASALKFGKKAVVSAAEFDTATRLQRVFTDITAGTQERILTPQAKRIGQETPFTNLDVVKAQTAAMQGLPSAMGPDVKAQVAAGMVEHAKYFATLMQVDLKEASEGIRSFLITTGKDISTQDKALFEARKAVNQVVRMAKLGGMSGEDAQQYMKYAAAAATAAGVSPEAAMSIGALARRGGLRGDEAGTFMRTLSAKLVAPGRPGITALSAAGIDYNQYRTMPERLDPKNLEMQFQNRLGVSFSERIRAQLEKAMSDPSTLGNQGKFTAEVSKILGGITGKGGGAASKAKVASAISDFYQMSAKTVDAQRLLDDMMANEKLSLAQLNALLGYRQGGRGAITHKQREEYTAARKEIGAAGDDPDFAKRRFDEVAAGLGYSLENLKGSIENLTLSIGQANEGLLKFSMDAMGKAFDWVAELPAAARQAITALGALGALGAAVGGIKLLMEGFGLKGSAVALDGAAAALNAAAARLGVAGAAGAAGGAAAAGAGATGAAAGAGAAGAAAGAGATGGAAAAAAGRSLLSRVMFGTSAIGGAYTLIETLHQATKEYEGKNLKQRRGDITEARRKAWNEERERLGLPPLAQPPRMGAPPMQSGFKPGPVGAHKDVPLRVHLDPIDDQIEGVVRGFKEHTGKVIDALDAIGLGTGSEPVERKPTITAPEPDRTPAEVERPAPAPLGKARPPEVSPTSAPRVPTAPTVQPAAPTPPSPVPTPAEKRQPAPRKPVPQMDGLSDGPVVPQFDMTPLDDAAEKARQTGEAMKQSLDVSAKPTIDLASLAEANRLADEFERKMHRIASMTARPTIAPSITAPSGGGVTPTSGSAQRASEAVRTAFADYGIRDV